MTFLVVGDFVLNAKFLDEKRLGKQRVEAQQLIDAIEKGTKWSKHPAALSWWNYVNALKYYANCVIAEWIERGFNNNMPFYKLENPVILPWWSQWDNLHYSHRAMLIRKNPFYYKDKFYVEPVFWNFGYIWPNKITQEKYNGFIGDLTDKIPDELKNPVYCQQQLVSGKRKGQCCNMIVKSKDSSVHPFCGLHIKSHKR
jgi:hypothetical protein